MQRAVERLALGPADAWLVGDSLTEDRGAAAAAGVAFVWFTRVEMGKPSISSAGKGRSKPRRSSRSVFPSSQRPKLSGLRT